MPASRRRPGDEQVIGFVMTNAGLMGNLSLNGNRITRLSI